MEKIKPSRSECCTAEIVAVEISSGWYQDVCSKCNKTIYYGLVRSINESAGIGRKHDGTLWFVHAFTSNWQGVVDSHFKYIGMFDGACIDSISERMNKYPDRIEYIQHKWFSDLYKNKVQNPELAL